MGIQQSVAVNKYEEITNSMTEVIINNLSECGGTTDVNQRVSIKGISGDLNIGTINMKSTVRLTVTCLQDSANDLKIKDEIEAKLKQQAKGEASGGGVLPNAAQSISENTTKIIKNIRNRVDISNIRRSLLQSISEQSVDVNFVGGDANIAEINMESVQENILESINKDAILSENIKKLSTETDQSATSSAAAMGVAAAGSSSSVSVVLLLLLAAGAFMAAKKKNVV